MQITQTEIEKIATLARLAINDEEKIAYANDLSMVFNYIEILNEVETADIPETCQVTGLMDRARPDVTTECELGVRASLVEQFPEQEANLLRVKAVFNE